MAAVLKSAYVDRSGKQWKRGDDVSSLPADERAVLKDHGLLETATKKAAKS